MVSYNTLWKSQAHITSSTSIDRIMSVSDRIGFEAVVVLVIKVTVERNGLMIDVILL